MLVLCSLLILTFSSLCCFLLSNFRLLKFYNGWKYFSDVLDKHAYGLLRSILHGSYMSSTRLTSVFNVCNSK